jgi:hypothetical protein
MERLESNSDQQKRSAKSGWSRIDWRRLRPRSRRSASALTAVFLISMWFAVGQDLSAGGDTWKRQDILDAIRWVESRNRDDVEDGDNGKAIGPYQIHYVYWFDAHQFDKSIGGTYQDCRKRRYAERVIDAYMRRHAAVAWTSGEAQTIARVHNGGPKGYLKRATEGYWKRVRRRLPAPLKKTPNRVDAR